MKVMLFNASPKNYGATQEILNTVKEALPKNAQTDEVCLGDVQLKFCIGCKRCYDTHGCVQGEEVREILHRMDACDAVVVACPSYWADIPAQFKAFIDRCTPYSDTAPDNGHWHLHEGIKCYGIALRTGGRPMECEHILASIDHFCGHMGMKFAGSTYLTRIEDKNDIELHKTALHEQTAEWFKEK